MQQINVKRVLERTRLGGENALRGIVQEIEIWPNEQLVYAQPRIRRGEWDA